MLQGVPAIYYHSLLGSENDIAGLNASGSIAVLTVKTGFRHHASGISHARIPTSEDLCRTNDITAHSPTTSAFSPAAAQQVLTLPDALFGVKRHHQTEEETVYGIVNVTGASQTLLLPVTGTDLLTGTPLMAFANWRAGKRSGSTSRHNRRHKTWNCLH